MVENNKKICATDRGLMHAFEDADKHNWTKEKLEAYDYVLMRELDDRGRLSFAQTIVQKDFALKLISRGGELVEISTITGLTLEQV